MIDPKICPRCRAPVRPDGSCIRAACRKDARVSQLPTIQAPPEYLEGTSASEGTHPSELIECARCGSRIAPLGRTCPECGTERKETEPPSPYDVIRSGIPMPNVPSIPAPRSSRRIKKPQTSTMYRIVDPGIVENIHIPAKKSGSH